MKALSRLDARLARRIPSRILREFVVAVLLFFALSVPLAAVVLWVAS